MSDLGVNSGYIVSKKGFQAGAQDTIVNTNVKLLTWIQFQEVFVDQWYWTCLTRRTKETLDPLCSYLEPIPAMVHWDEYLATDEIARLKEMYDDHFKLFALIFAIHPVRAMLRNKRERLRLPLGDCTERFGNLPESLTSRMGYVEFFGELLRYCLPILAEFQRFRDLALSRKRSIEINESNC